MHVTTSGNFSNPALLCCVMELGIDRILFAVDWPFVANKPAIEDSQRQCATPVPSLRRDIRLSLRVIAGSVPALYGMRVRLALRPPPARCAGPVAQWSEPTAHNGLVGGSSPPGPTTYSLWL
jgi:hypothetical protein